MNPLKLFFIFTILGSTVLISCNGEKNEIKTETDKDNKDRYTYEIEMSLDGETLDFSKLGDRYTSFRMYKDGMELSFRTDEEKFKQIGVFIYTENPEITNATDFDIINASSSKSYGSSIMNFLGTGGFSGFSCDGSLQVTKSTPQEIIMTFDAMLYGIENAATGLCPNNLKGKIKLKTSFEREIIDVKLIN